MKISEIHAYEIYDSRGIPTIACELFLESGEHVTAAVPSGASVGKFEALEVRDGGDRLNGKGVKKAIDTIYQKIAPQFVGREIEAIIMDQELIALDDSAQKKKLGANAMLAVSMALFRGHALALGLELYDFMARSLDYDEMTMPVPMINVFNGGRHASNKLSVQEYLLIPYGARSFAQAMEISVEIFYELKKLLEQAGKSTCTGDEGGFAPVFNNSVEPLEFLVRAIQRAGYDSSTVGIGMDVAASEFYNEKRGEYLFDGKNLKAHELIAWYIEQCHKFPIISLEDPLAQDDWLFWVELKKLLGSTVKIVGDDLLVTSATRINHAIELEAANAAIIKPNQVGTVSEAIQAVLLCQEHGWTTVASHRSGETPDTFMADFALGVRANYVKFGGCNHGERLAKYNRLLQIEFFKSTLMR